MAEAIQFTISVRDTLAQHLPRLSADHALLRILTEEEPGSEIWRRELNNDFAYRVAKRAYKDYVDARAKAGVVVGEPIDVSQSREP
ncbi:hypothetical protein Dshi_0101 [Dinoroseobacter shibae DFL 12 = DSM 16493]|uniref:Uncharacterized protein n=1 Tax=Dinoroseobacter shibae (strain DSM 16493 / NCIMB 14021 / DFL 12) TaxID=398580 RepID=A8LKK7_DINSH|nr:hypothetical protein Dshi_0101 [Dinoroseobacter shibae DFL 12 = DSM 16493]